jgi:hypothetical protein
MLCQQYITAVAACNAVGGTVLLVLPTGCPAGCLLDPHTLLPHRYASPERRPIQHGMLSSGLRVE